MCCSTGVCGPQVDPALVRFAADLEWLKANGVEVERFNLSQEPAAFVGNPVVAQAIRGARRRAPAPARRRQDRRRRAATPRAKCSPSSSGSHAPKSIYSEAVQELVAIGAAIASNCEPCFRYHFDKARKLGVSKEDMARAVTTAKMVKDSPARAVVELAEKYLGTKVVTKEGPDACRAPAEAAPVALGVAASSPKKCC